MAELPFLSLETSAWLADTGHLDRVERGLYMDLLILMWRTPGCRVPNDMAWICRKLRVQESEKTALENIISEFCQTTGNWITQKRLTKTFENASASSKKQSDRAKARWNKENDGSRGNANHNHNYIKEGRKVSAHTRAREEAENQPPEHTAPEPASHPESVGVPQESFPAADALEIATACARMAGVRLVSPGHIVPAVDLVRNWLKAGADPPLIRETISRVVGGLTPETRIGSLKYFDGAVMRAAAQANGGHHERNHRAGRATARQPTATDIATERLAQLLRQEAERGVGPVRDAGLLVLGHVEPRSDD